MLLSEAGDLLLHLLQGILLHLLQGILLPLLDGSLHLIQLSGDLGLVARILRYDLNLCLERLQLICHH